MSEIKYGNLFYTYDPAHDKGRPVSPGIPFRIIARLNDTIFKGSFFYFVHWVLPHATPFLEVGHPPHIHKDAELLFHIGTNPDDPTDLGAEIEMYMGKELERHVITKSTVIYIPPNFIHCPWKAIRTDRPWIFVEVNQGPVHTEKGFPQILPKEIREKQDISKFSDEGF